MAPVNGKEPARIGNVMAAFLDNHAPKTVANCLVIHSIWPKIVGANMAKKTMPLKIIGKTLYLTVETSAWMEELKYLKEDIIKKINNDLKQEAVEDIIFRLGKINLLASFPRSHQQTASSSAPLPQLSRQEIDNIDKLVSCIKDTILKETVRQAMIMNKRRNTQIINRLGS
ncbi:MAG: DUF721 domain-containing protein [Deltaproteobacteria bacterium]|nr:DUF721 domain-containing protein [Deltaproteobacteria bacterium]